MNNKIYTGFGQQTGSCTLLKKDINIQASEAGFSAEKLEELEFLITEMTANLPQYTQKAELRMRIAEERNRKYLELICIDSAPGIADDAKMKISKSAGLTQKVLENIKRLSDYFEIFNMSGWGSILICRIYKNAK